MALTSSGLLYLMLCHYLPGWMGSTRNPDCKMNMLHWNDVYAICFLLPTLIANLYFIAGYRLHLYLGKHPVAVNDWLKRTLTIIMIGAALLTLVGYTTWFFFAVRMWKVKTDACTQGWNQLDMLNFMFLTAFTGWPAAVTVVLVIVSIFMSPLIFSSIQEYYQRASEQRDIINTIVRTNWDPEIFKAQDDCAICTVAFKQEDKVTPLPCDAKHYFHSECIAQWFEVGQQTTSCPICRTQFTKQQMQDYSETVTNQLNKTE